MTVAQVFLSVESVALSIRRPEHAAWLTPTTGHALDTGLGVSSWAEVLVDLAWSPTVLSITLVIVSPVERKVTWTPTLRSWGQGIVTQLLGLGTGSTTEDLITLSGGRPVDQLPAWWGAGVGVGVSPGWSYDKTLWSCGEETEQQTLGQHCSIIVLTQHRSQEDCHLKKYFTS